MSNYTQSIDFSVKDALPTGSAGKVVKGADVDTELALIATAIATKHDSGANIDMQGFRHVDVGAAQSLTDYARADDVIDQALLYHTDTGAADAYEITPDPAITAYAVGQRFVFNAANANTGSSTLVVNGLAAKAIEYPNGNALSAGAIVAGGVYEVTYNGTSFVLTSAPSEIPDSMLSSNVALLDAPNEFTANPTISAPAPRIFWKETDADTDEKLWQAIVQNDGWKLQTRTDGDAVGQDAIEVTRTVTNVDLVALSGDSITANGSEVLTEADEASLAINTDQLTTDFTNDASTTHTVGNGDAESIRRFTASSAVTITLPNSTPPGWAIGDSMGIIRGGTGSVTFSSTGTIRTPGGSDITVQHGKAVATLAASGVWELSGNV